ncbi:MAG: HPF/RaiA family ribosome-associated protein [Candidatus Omnitrophica bacterium]|nr:HPF/RaiA family ribosome-associated protein [Candidatus Omnitrophota bacterium]
MKLPLELIMKNVEHKQTIEAVVNEKVAKLEMSCDHIISCRVFIEQNPTHQHAKHTYHVRIDVRMPPHHEIVIKRDSGRNAHDDLSAVVREAFAAARRQVEVIVDRQKRKVKSHTLASMMPSKLRKFLKMEEE